MSGQWGGGGSGRGEWSGVSVFGVVLIVVGGIFLVDGLGFLHFGWRMLWPVLLIAIGAVVLVNAVAREGARHQGPGAASTAIARDGAGRLELEVAVGAGTFSLGGGSGQLVEVRSSVSDIAAQQRRDGDLAQVRLRQDLASFGGWRGNTSWEIRLASDVPTRLKFDAGAGSFDVDLGTLAIVEAKLQVGAARTRIVLPRPRGEVVVSITGGAASFAIEVPSGVEYRFESSGGLTSIDGLTQSPGYGTASDHVLVRFTGGASSVRNRVIEPEGAGGLADGVPANGVPAVPAALAGPQVREEPLSQNRDFLLLLGGQGISAFGDALSLTALPLLVLALTGSGIAMGIVGVLNTIPDLVFGLLAGVIADRSDRRVMILGADFGRAVLTGLIPLSILLGGPTIAVILLIAAPMAMLRSLFLAAYTAAMPSLVGRPLLARATSTLETVYSLSFVVGPSVAGLLAAVVGYGPTIAIDALSFLASSLAMALIRRPLQERQDRPALNLRAEIGEGIAYIAGHPTLRIAVSFWGLSSVITAGLIPVLTYFITRQLQLGTTAFGVLLSINGIGYLLGAIGMNRVRVRAAGRLMLIGTALEAIAMIAAVNGQVIVLFPAAFVVGAASAGVVITYITLRSAAAPDELLGRVGSTARTLSIGLQPLGMITAGVLLDTIGGGATLLLMGSALLIATIAFSASRALRGALVIGGHVPR